MDEVAFGLFIPLPGTPLWDIAKNKNNEMDFLDLLAVGDMNKAVSWNDELNAEEKYVIMCRTGVRSAQICEFLANQNFKSVANLTGGINEWAQKVDTSKQVY